MSIENRLKRLEKKLSENAPVGLNAEEQRNFISEKSEATQMYFKATTKQEEQEAANLIAKVDEKYNRELPKGYKGRYSVEELEEMLRGADDE